MKKQLLFILVLFFALDGFCEEGFMVSIRDRVWNTTLNEDQCKQVTALVAFCLGPNKVTKVLIEAESIVFEYDSGPPLEKAKKERSNPNAYDNFIEEVQATVFLHNRTYFTTLFNNAVAEEFPGLGPGFHTFSPDSIKPHAGVIYFDYADKKYRLFIVSPASWDDHTEPLLVLEKANVTIAENLSIKQTLNLLAKELK